MKGKKIYEILERLNELSSEQKTRIGDNLCPVYSPPQVCVKSKCIWYDVSDHGCWVLNPKPKPDYNKASYL